MNRKQIIILGVIVLGLLYSACGEYGITSHLPRSLRLFKKGNDASIYDACIKALVKDGFTINNKYLLRRRIEGDKEDRRIAVYLYNSKGGLLGLDDGMIITICEYIVINEQKRQIQEIDADQEAYSIKDHIEEYLNDHERNF